MQFEPDYRNIVAVAGNRKPARLPLYEHIISEVIMERILGESFADRLNGDDSDVDYFFKKYCHFFKQMTYDTVSFESCIVTILPSGGDTLRGRKPGPIQNRSDFDSAVWRELPDKYWALADRHFKMLGKNLPGGMKAIGGVGNGVFEISEDLVGLERLAYMYVDDPILFADIFQKIGDLMVEIWTRFLDKYSKHYAVCRFGDDLGYKSGTMLSPAIIRKFIIPQYRRIIDLVHKAGVPFLWHSCGNIFDIMDDAIEIGIDAKHSNEDIIAPFDTWIDRYGGKIGLFGGIDVDLLCQSSPDEVYEKVVLLGNRFRDKAKGYALGSGNSIPDYVPVEGYLAMVRAVKDIRGKAN